LQKLAFFAKIGIFRKKYLKWRFCDNWRFAKSDFHVCDKFFCKNPMVAGKSRKLEKKSFFVESDFCGCDNRKSFRFLGEGQGNFAKIRLYYFKNHNFRCEIQFLQKKFYKHFCNARRYIPMW
jgi:hypothetical protein